MGSQSAAIGEQLRNALAQACRALALEIDKELRRSGTGTPVDTGHARANWVPSIGTPALEEVEGLSAHAAGVAAVLKFKLGDGALFISNGVPYINRLNYGHSKQAPRLFVEACIDRALSTIQARYAGRISIDRASVFAGSAGGQEYLGGEAAANLASSYSPFGGD